MISICMAYFNRKQQLFKTLDSINESSFKDYEVIIVDDGSIDEHMLNMDELKTHCSGTIKLFTINRNKKFWYNSCIAYNLAFSNADGDKIIIQNPETYHMGDILSTVENNLNDSNYLTVHTLSVNESTTNEIYTKNNITEVSNYIQPIMNKTLHIGSNGDIIWYNHRLFRPNHYHFISAITKNNLYTLGGFDERYKDDHSYDDDEFILRVSRLKLHLQFIESPQAIHLYHPIFYVQAPHGSAKNANLYHNTTRKETTIQLQELNFNNYIQYLIC